MRARLHLRRPVSTLIPIAIICLAQGRAQAQSAEAEALFSEGNARMAEGKLAQACDAFEASNRVEARAGTLIRLGECREQNHQLASAWSAYKDALNRVKDQRKREVATAKAAALEPRLSYVTVSVSDESRVDGLTLARNGKLLDPMLWNRALPMDGGDYIIAGRAPGHEEWQTTAHVPDEGGRISVEVPKFKEMQKLVLPPAPKPTPAPVQDQPPPPPPVATGVFTTRRTIAVVSGGVAVIAVAVGVVLGESAKTKQSDAFKLCPDPAMACASADAANALIESGRSRALASNVVFAGAGVAAIAAGVLWFTGAPDVESPRRVSVVPTIAPGTTGFVVSGRF